MKNLVLFLCSIFFVSFLAAQAPFKFNFQAAVRDGSGILANATMDIRIGILDLGPTGTVLYQEIHQNKQTDQFGLINLRIGDGMPITGSMAGIAWGVGNKFLKVETNYGGGNYQTIGAPVQLVSVPYALYAERSGSSSADDDPTNEIQTLAINGNELSISGGNALILPIGPTYNAGPGINISGNNISAQDESNSNEIQFLDIFGNQLSISGGNTIPLPTGTNYSAGAGISISGNTISNTGDNDNDPTNEIQTLIGNGGQLSLSSGGGFVNAGIGISISGNTLSNAGDNDNDPTNEIQTLSIINGNQLSLSNGGPPLTLPGGANYTEGEGIEISAGNVISAVDISSTNEIQAISGSGNQLSLSKGGGTIAAGDGIDISSNTINSTTWKKSGTNVVLSTASNRVGIGTSSPSDDLTVNQTIQGINSSGGKLYRLNQITGDGGYFATFGPNGQENFVVSSPESAPSNNYGYAAVTGPAGGEDNYPRAGMLVNTNSALLFTYASSGSSNTKNFVMDHPTQSGKHIWFACIEGPEAAAYERGTIQLSNGEAIVPFSENFVIVVNPETMTVMLTPLDASSKGLAVIEKTSKGFKIKELGNGSGNYKVDWEAKGVRKGHENYQVVRNAIEIMPAMPARNNE